MNNCPECGTPGKSDGGNMTTGYYRLFHCGSYMRNGNVSQSKDCRIAQLEAEVEELKASNWTYKKSVEEYQGSVEQLEAEVKALTIDRDKARGCLGIALRSCERRKKKLETANGKIAKAIAFIQPELERLEATKRMADSGRYRMSREGLKDLEEHRQLDAELREGE